MSSLGYTLTLRALKLTVYVFVVNILQTKKALNTLFFYDVYMYALWTVPSGASHLSEFAFRVI